MFSLRWLGSWSALSYEWFKQNGVIYMWRSHTRTQTHGEPVRTDGVGQNDLISLSVISTIDGMRVLPLYFKPYALFTSITIHDLCSANVLIQDTKHIYWILSIFNRDRIVTTKQNVVYFSP